MWWRMLQVLTSFPALLQPTGGPARATCSAGRLPSFSRHGPGINFIFLLRRTRHHPQMCSRIWFLFMLILVPGGHIRPTVNPA